MLDYLEKMLKSMRSAFSYETTFVWFVLVFVGLMTRAKKSYVGYLKPDQPKKRRRGRPRK